MESIFMKTADYIKMMDSDKNWTEPTISIIPTFIGFIIFPEYSNVLMNGNRNGRHIHGFPKMIGRTNITA